MPNKQKYNYDIKIIQDGLNIGLSINEIARLNGWPQANTHQWLIRNYEKSINISYNEKCQCSQCYMCLKKHFIPVYKELLKHLSSLTNEPMKDSEIENYIETKKLLYERISDMLCDVSNLNDEKDFIDRMKYAENLNN